MGHLIGETVTAALLNTHVRDNLTETAPSKVTTAGDIVYATAANALARLAGGDSLDHQVLRASAAPVWSSISDVIDLGHGTSVADTTLTSTTWFTIASVTFNPGWAQFNIFAWGGVTILGGGSGNRFEVRVTDGTTPGTASDTGCGASTQSCYAGASYAVAGFTASTTMSVQARQTDAGTDGTADSGFIHGIIQRTG